MSESRRYFNNILPDYKNESVIVSNEEWRNKVLNVVQMIRENQPYEDNSTSLYIGTGGIAYMFYFLSQLPLYSEEKNEFLDHALKYIDASLKHIKGLRMDNTGFLTRHSGVYAVAAVIYNAVEIVSISFASTGDTQNADKYLSRYIEVTSDYKQHQGSGADEFFVGRAGYLSGALWLDRQLGEGAYPQSVMKDMCDSMMILSVPESLRRDPKIEHDVRASVDYVLSLQTPAGNFPPMAGDSQRRGAADPDDLVQWCHGAAGIVYLMAKAYLQWRDEKYLQSCFKCGEIIWNNGLLKKGPGSCHCQDLAWLSVFHDTLNVSVPLKCSIFVGLRNITNSIHPSP
ncbi:LanC-like protein 3 homolog [Gryllus bimaculatus]|nr:LanC-like protein 3 homolog [Gryllus bimaculatus]